MASSSKAAQLAAEEPGSAAIASSIAAEIYGLKALCQNIEDVSNNITRFLIISKKDALPSGDDKTIILFSTAHRTGALVDVLNVFRSYDLNMTNIGSRPNKKREWEYYFFVDFLGTRKMQCEKGARRGQEPLPAAFGAWAVSANDCHFIMFEIRNYEHRRQI